MKLVDKILRYPAALLLALVITNQSIHPLRELLQELLPFARHVLNTSWCLGVTYFGSILVLARMAYLWLGRLVPAS